MAKLKLTIDSYKVDSERANRREIIKHMHIILI